MRELLLVLEDGDAAFAETQYVADLLFGRVAAPRNVGGAEAEYREVGYEPFPAVVGDEADMVASGHTELEQAGGEYLDVLEEGRVARGLEFAAFVLGILSGKLRIGSHSLEEHLGNGVRPWRLLLFYILTSSVRLCN